MLDNQRVAQGAQVVEGPGGPVNAHALMIYNVDATGLLVTPADGAAVIDFGAPAPGTIIPLEIRRLDSITSGSVVLLR